jgi:predicted nucleotidyltransferase
MLKLRFVNNVKDVILFGSRAYGKAKKDSDYDILIIMKQSADWKIKREFSEFESFRVSEFQSFKVSEFR